MTNHSIWVGMDVHADKINMAIYYDQEMEVREERQYVPDESGVKQLVKKLRALEGTVRCIYEAGPCGYWLQRLLKEKGIGCEMAAPSLIPQQVGNRVKTDRRDARKLGRLYRAGELTTIALPEPEQEALRDLLRLREDVSEQIQRQRNQLSRFLLRHQYRYRGGRAWTQKHWDWIGKIQMTEADAQTTLEEYTIGLRDSLDQLERLDQRVEAAAQRPRYAPLVAKLKVLRGIGTLTALTLIAEFGDLKRYTSAPAFRAALGVVPSESSSGSREQKGPITKTGNAHGRRVVVEAGWHYRHRPGLSRALRQRRKGQSAEVLAIAKRADLRLSQKYHRLLNQGKRPVVAVVAVARELAGFLWALGQVA
jgi:transposase